AARLLPFFALGIVFFRSNCAIRNNYRSITALTIAILSASYAGYIYYGGNLFSLMVGFSGCSLLFLAFPATAISSFVGRYSFSIFLMHSMFAAAALRLFDETPFPSLVVVVLLSLFGPIAVEKAMVRIAP